MTGNRYNSRLVHFSNSVEEHQNNAKRPMNEFKIIPRELNINYPLIQLSDGDDDDVVVNQFS